MDTLDTSRWTCIYPAYIASKLKRSQGRQVNNTEAIDNPQPNEISEVLTFLKIPHIIENKAYPRDILMRGRVKACLKMDDGRLINSEVPSKKVLLRKLCCFIPRLKCRVNAEEGKGKEGKGAGKGARNKRKK